MPAGNLPRATSVPISQDDRTGKADVGMQEIGDNIPKLANYSVGIMAVLFLPVMKLSIRPSIGKDHGMGSK